MALPFTLSKEEETFLGKQAKLAIQTRLDEDVHALPLTPPGNWQAEAGKPESTLMRLHGVFVTLNLNGQLRGCMGSIVGREPLYLEIWHIARMAAFSDPRFPPLTEAEWKKCEMDISVLTEPAPCPGIDKIEIGRDGLILQYRGHQGLFLPQVPVEQKWNLEQYLDHLCLKAGVPAGSWRNEGATIFCFQALVFPVQ